MLIFDQENQLGVLNGKKNFASEPKDVSVVMCLLKKIRSLVNFFCKFRGSFIAILLHDPVAKR